MRHTFNPGWLVSLMCQWVRHELSIQDRSLGYPKKSHIFSLRTTGGHDHSDPTAFHAKDYRELERALDLLRDDAPPQYAAMMMYYKPWCVNALRGEGWPFGNSTYYDRIHRAHAYVARAMEPITQ